MSARRRVAEFLGLERNVMAAGAAMLLMALAENLWKKFLPKYLEALGAPIRAIGAYGSLSDLVDGLYQYPGGWLGDHLGRRNALTLFVVAALCGYAIYAAAGWWPVALLGILFAAAWTSMASPTLFAVVGDALPRERRTLGFTVQAVLRRAPVAVAPVIGGILIAREGIVAGMRILFIVAIGVALVTLFAVRRIDLPRIASAPTGIGGVWAAMPSQLRWLLASDIFIRTCEGMAEVFLVIYATSVLGLTAPQFGVLVSVQAVTSMLVYIPAAKIADRIGRKPFVIATFLCFAAFPLAVAYTTSFAWAVAAFAVGGLREIGEPARKALIVDFARPELRGRTVGLYYLIRSAAIAPAAIIGGILWERQPSLPLIVAFVIGLAGTVVFAATVEEQYA